MAITPIGNTGYHDFPGQNAPASPVGPAGKTAPGDFNKPCQT